MNIKIKMDNWKVREASTTGLTENVLHDEREVEVYYKNHKILSFMTSGNVQHIDLTKQNSLETVNYVSFNNGTLMPYNSFKNSYSVKYTTTN